MGILSIEQVVRRAGVGVETVRFYEREGELSEQPRRASGYRQYSEQVVTRLHFIKCAKFLGFSLKEITELLLLVLPGRRRNRVPLRSSLERIQERGSHDDPASRGRMAHHPADCPVLWTAAAAPVRQRQRRWTARYGLRDADSLTSLLDENPSSRAVG